MIKGKKNKEKTGLVHFPVFFTTPEGLQILKEIDKHCDFGNDVFNMQNERANAYNQGRQSVAIWIRKTIKEQKENA